MSRDFNAEFYHLEEFRELLEEQRRDALSLKNFKLASRLYEKEVKIQDQIIDLLAEWMYQKKSA